jgi:hypothetical protein
LDTAGFGIRERSGKTSSITDEFTTTTYLFASFGLTGRRILEGKSTDE